MASSGKMLVEMALKKAMQQQDDQTVAVKADTRVRKDNIPSLGVSITMFVGVTITEIISTILGSTANESRPAEAVVADTRSDIPATTYEQESEIDINEGSFDSDIHKTPAMPTAEQDAENYCNNHNVIVAKTVTVSTLSNSSSKSRPVDTRSNMPAITTLDSEIDVNKGSSDSDINETPAKPAAEECSENHDDGYDDEQINEVPQQQPESRPK